MSVACSETQTHCFHYGRIALRSLLPFHLRDPGSRPTRLIEDGGRIAFSIDERFDDAGSTESECPVEPLAKLLGGFCRAARHAEIMRRRFGRRAEMDAGER